MAKVQLPLLGVKMTDKTLLIVIAGMIGLFLYLKKDLEGKIVAGAKAVKSGLLKPSGMFFDYLHPTGEYEKKAAEIRNRLRRNIALNKLIRRAQAGEYTTRADGKH